MRILLTILAVLTLAPMIASAEENKRVYRWVDEDGVVHFGDSVPAEYADIERQVVNEHGVTVEVLRGKMTAEEIAEEQRLQKLAERIEREIGAGTYRVYVDSAPVLEKPLAQKAGLGWIGKHTNLIAREAGSWFFLGEIYTDLDLPVDEPQADHCGTCTRCIDICPTRAIIGPYKLDARRCVSYLTIELRGSMPRERRADVDDWVLGCDICQEVCPWNRKVEPDAGAEFRAGGGQHDAQPGQLCL